MPFGSEWIIRLLSFYASPLSRILFRKKDSWRSIWCMGKEAEIKTSPKALHGFAVQHQKLGNTFFFLNRNDNGAYSLDYGYIDKRFRLFAKFVKISNPILFFNSKHFSAKLKAETHEWSKPSVVCGRWNCHMEQLHSQLKLTWRPHAVA